MKPTYAIVPGAWVRVELLRPTFGISSNSASNYRRSGSWSEGIHFKKDPANRYVYNTRRIEEWLAL